MRVALLFAFIVFGLVSCTEDPFVDLGAIDNDLEFIPPSSQRGGDPIKGREYLITGDYINSGIPLDVFNNTLGRILESDNLLNRSGNNADLPYSYSAVAAENGVEVVAPNCLQCHGGFVNGEFVLGLGDNAADYTLDQSVFSGQLDGVIASIYSEDSPEWEAYFPFSRSINATAPGLITDVVGVNPADKLAVILAAHRDNQDLSWSDQRLFSVSDELMPADVPAWWLLKKKNAMFGTGIGRGDFSRIMMASSVLVIKDTIQAALIDENFADVLAFINTLEAPKYPGTIDMGKVQEGEMLFAENCAKCHGTYGANETYPNFIVKHDLIQTDPHLANNDYADETFGNWYNNSWFAKGAFGARVEKTDGYMAPPLDGIWATAPYLHNGSVPTLDVLLDSESRPTYWDKRLSSDTYDLEKVGIDFIVQDSKNSNYTYDTTKKGYGNQGHYFADHFSDKQRSRLIEYLKTL